MLTELLSAIQVGMETKKIAEGLYNGDHCDDVTQAWNMYEAIDFEGESMESEIREVLQRLEPVDSSDRLFVRVGAWTLQAWCYAHLGKYTKARQYCKHALNAPLDEFTLNKDVIKDLQADCRRLEILIHNTEHPDNPIIDYDNDEKYQEISDIVDDVLAQKLDVYDFTDEDNIFDNLGADSLDAVELAMEIEGQLGITISDEELQPFSTYSIGEIKTALYKIVMGIQSPAIAEPSSGDTSPVHISEDEKEYLEMYNEYSASNGISERDRKMLDKFRSRLGISEERARELEESCSKPQLTEDEQEYLEMFKEYAADGEISDRDRKMLNKMRDRMGISEERAKEIEKI